MSVSSLKAETPHLPQVKLNPAFDIEKAGGCSITAVVIGVLFITGGVTVGVLGFQEVLPLGKTWSIVTISAGPLLGVILIVTGVYRKALSNCYHGLKSASKTNKDTSWKAWLVWMHAIKKFPNLRAQNEKLAEAYDEVGFPVSQTIPKKQGLIQLEIASYTFDKDNSESQQVALNSFINGCSENSIPVYLTLQERADEIDVKISTLVPK